MALAAADRGREPGSDPGLFHASNRGGVILPEGVRYALTNLPCEILGTLDGTDNPALRISLAWKENAGVKKPCWPLANALPAAEDAPARSD